MKLPGLILIFAALGILGGASAHAQQHFVSDSSVAVDLPLPSASVTSVAPAAAPSTSAAAPRLSQADAANIVRKLNQGQVMAVQPRTSGSKTHYAVKVLHQGRMRTILVDGDTGTLQ